MTFALFCIQAYKRFPCVFPTREGEVL